MRTATLRRTLAEMAGLALAVVLLFCFLYGRTSAQAWRTPPLYRSDALLILALSQGYAETGPGSILDKQVARLDAPYAANWNEWPITEDGLFYLHGFLDQAFGLGAAANLILLLAHLLAALSFYAVCRWLRYRRSLSAALALLYAFSWFLMARGYVHLPLSYCWHLPLCLLVTWWAASARPFNPRSLRFVAALIISFLCGAQNAYYSFLYLQLLAWAGVALALRRQWRNLLFPLANIGAVLFAVLLGNLDTFLNALRHGANHGAVVRGFTGLEIYALRPLELFLLPDNHRLGLFHWFWRAHGEGEGWSVYLGLIGAAGLILIAWKGIEAALLRREGAIPVHFWQALWVLGFSIVDGGNAVLGVLGFQVFRGTNRYSIVLLALALLFLARFLTRTVPRRWSVGVAVVLLGFGLWDQTPRNFPLRDAPVVAHRIEADRAFTAQLEQALPPGAMVFQLPVSAFPEHPPIERMADYEHFRPFLFSKNLRFSYGGTKGRPREAWQAQVEQLPPAEMIAQLEQYGFAAIYIDRNGYADNGTALIADLTKAGATPLEDGGENGMVALRITPSASPILPIR